MWLYSSVTKYNIITIHHYTIVVQCRNIHIQCTYTVIRTTFSYTLNTRNTCTVVNARVLARQRLIRASLIAHEYSRELTRNLARSISY